MSSLKKHNVLSALGKSEQNRLFTSVFLQSFATSLIGIFVPIYLLKHGFEIDAIIIFYLIHYIVCLPISSLGMFINNKFGVKKAMATGMALQLSGYIALSFVNGFNTAAVLATTLLASGGTVYHLGYHIELTRSLKNHREGQGLSTLYICALTANLMGPLLGALFVTGISFNALIGVIGVMLAVAMVPLFRTADYKLPIETYNPIKVLATSRMRQSVIYSSQGAIKLAQDIFWPIFIYLIVRNVISMGILISISSSVVVIATYYIGKYIDKNSVRSLQAGVASHFLSWNLKLALLSPIGILFTNFLSSLSLSLVDNSFNKVMYTGAKHTRKQSTYFLYREYTMLLGRIATLTLLLIVTDLPLFFVVTALLGMTMLLPIRDMRPVAV